MMGDQKINDNLCGEALRGRWEGGGSDMPAS